MSLFVPILASLLVFGAIVYLGYATMRNRDQRARRRALAMVSGYATNNVHQALQDVDRQDSMVREAMLALGMRFTSKSSYLRLQKQCLYAGRNDVGATEDAVIRKVLYAFGGLLLGFLLGISLGGLWWIALLVFAVFGFFLPDILIYNQGLKRQEEIAKRLPDALDMLNLCVESGLSFQAAMSQVATNQSGPVADEFGIALAEMQLGRSRGEALSAMAGRTRQVDVQRFVSAMLQVDKIGVPVATVLREQAKEMRAKRYARAREQAQKVPVKILMPLMLCFLPALFVIILGPAVYSIVQVFSST